MASVTRLSICPWMITTSSGRSVPRWIATALHTLVGLGTRGSFVTVSHVCRVSSPSCFISASAQRTAAPIPRLRSVCDEKRMARSKTHQLLDRRFHAARVNRPDIFGDLGLGSRQGLRGHDAAGAGRASRSRRPGNCSQSASMKGPDFHYKRYNHRNLII